MGNNFHAVNAKIGVLKKGIFNDDDYNKLLSFSKREDVINYLKNNPIYKDQIQEYEENSPRNRYAMEFMIHKTETEIFRKLEHFLFGEDKMLVEAMLTRYEFEDIKIILRSIVENEKINLAKETLMYGTSNHVNYDKLSKCDNIHQALDILKGTIYRRALLSLADEDVLRLHFHVEMNLDSLYFIAVKKATEKLSKSSQEILNSYYSTIIDTINLQWIIRAKRFYNLSNEEIYNYTLRFGKYIKGDFLKSLVYSENGQEIMDKLKGTKLERLLRNNEEGKIISYRNIQGYIYNSQLKKLKSYQNTISTFLKFIIQVLIQNENMTRIAEAQKYSLSKEETRKYLISTH
ncbi:V-type ATPase subunit [Peptoanaerobacter stomatis]|uniref:V-type ATPase subunit n=1 Tax=Peptoanaerobacter stomatis TaxID=796937 RepID=UPI003FA1574B